MLEHEAERWLSIQKDLGRAPNTLLAYRRSLESYGSFCLTLQRSDARLAQSPTI